MSLVTSLLGSVRESGWLAQAKNPPAPTPAPAPPTTQLAPESFAAKLIAWANSKAAEGLALVRDDQGAINCPKESGGHCAVAVRRFNSAAPQAAVMMRRSTFSQSFPDLPKKAGDPVTFEFAARVEVRGQGIDQLKGVEVPGDVASYCEFFPTIDNSVAVDPEHEVYVFLTPGAVIGGEKFDDQWIVYRFERENVEMQKAADGKLTFSIPDSTRTSKIKFHPYAVDASGKKTPYEQIGAGMIAQRIDQLNAKKEQKSITPDEIDQLERLTEIRTAVASGAEFVTGDGLWRIEKTDQGVDVTYTAKALFVPKGGSKKNVAVATMLPTIAWDTVNRAATRLKTGQGSGYSDRSLGKYWGETGAGRAFTDKQYQGPDWYLQK